MHPNEVSSAIFDKERLSRSGGIGGAIAHEIAKKKVKVINVDVFAPKTSPHENKFFYALDITSSSEIAKVAAQICKEHGEPTVLINNAGIGIAKPTLEVTEDRLRKLFDANIIAHFLLLQEFLPAMIRSNHGHVVTIGSLASFSTQASNVDYAATKAGELKFQYKAPKVRTIVVHPSWIRTRMVQELIDSGKMSMIVEQLYSTYGSQVVIPRSLWWVSAIRGFPSWLQENMRESVSKQLLEANS
ncbi:NAD(P)-binding protein [Setomelanomma holmii]|uniref:NAD(P)-binding protein n=1 Tax=Setomelanomma holmii TaxID=210430 RepID=A0A9P4LVH6_9PLEO|nr:NAD(P)-binding protein [Setomelanomma holmii]